MITGVTPAMECYREEIFGPVLVCLEVRPPVPPGGGVPPATLPPASMPTGACWPPGADDLTIQPTCR